MVFSWASIIVAVLLTGVWVAIGYIAGDHVFAQRRDVSLRKWSRRVKK